MNAVLYFGFLYVPDPLIYLLISIIAFFRSLYRIFAHSRMDVELINGYRNGYPVSMLWIGTNEMKKYILERLYDSEYKVTRSASTTLINLRATLDRFSPECDLIYVELNSLLPRLKGFKKIKQELVTRMRLEERNFPKYRRILRLIERNDVEFRQFKICNNIDMLWLFYDQLYAPYISSRWGENSVESFSSMKRFYAKGLIRLAYLDGEAIAGTLFLCRGATLVFCKYGIRDANDKVHRAAASIYSHLQYAEENNFTYYDAFFAKPFFNDGVFRFKRDCGLSAHIEKRNYYFDKDLYFRVTRYSPGVVDFLSNEPFIFVNDGKLTASLFSPDESLSLVDEIASLYHRYRTGGITNYELNIGRNLKDHERNEVYLKCGVADQENVINFVTYNAES